jgi:hypothetical protein
VDWIRLAWERKKLWGCWKRGIQVTLRLGSVLLNYGKSYSEKSTNFHVLLELLEIVWEVRLNTSAMRHSM